MVCFHKIHLQCLAPYKTGLQVHRVNTSTTRVYIINDSSQKQFIEVTDFESLTFTTPLIYSYSMHLALGNSSQTFICQITSHSEFYMMWLDGVDAHAHKSFWKTVAVQVRNMHDWQNYFIINLHARMKVGTYEDRTRRFLDGSLCSPYTKTVWYATNYFCNVYVKMRELLCFRVDTAIVCHNSFWI